MVRRIDTREQELNKDIDLILPASGDIVRNDQQIEVMDTPIADNYAASLAFMEEPVEVMLHESTDPNADNPVQVACNGVNQFFWRGQPITVKRKFVEILARSKQTAIQTKEVRDHSGALTTAIGKTTALRYPFSIISDQNRNGAVWLKRTLSEG